MRSGYGFTPPLLLASDPVINPSATIQMPWPKPAGLGVMAGIRVDTALYWTSTSTHVPLIYQIVCYTEKAELALQHPCPERV